MVAVAKPKEALPNLKLDIRLAQLARPSGESSESTPLREAAESLEESREHTGA
jgi:hypothetical protein